MEYVMVPVPEALVAEVKHYLRWNVAAPAVGGLDHDGAARFLGSLDEQALRFLLAVAKAAVEAEVLTVSEAAAAARGSELEALGLMLQLNAAVQYFGGLPLGLIQRDALASPDGTEGEPNYIFTMHADVGKILLTAAGRGAALTG